MKILDHLVFLGEVKGMRAADAKSKADKWLQRLGLGDWALKKVEDLSKGMQQKVQFAGTLIHDPELVILDEPFSGLDPVNLQVMKDVVVEIARSGRTVLFSTHIMEQAERMCDRIVIIARGEKVVDGTVNEVKAGFGERHIALTFAKRQGDGRAHTRRSRAGREGGRLRRQRGGRHGDRSRSAATAQRTGERRSRLDAVRSRRAVAAVDLHRQGRRRNTRSGECGGRVRKILVVVRRELNARIRTKAFIISTLLLPFFFIAVSVLPALLSSGGNRTSRVAIVDGSATNLGAAIETTLDRPETFGRLRRHSAVRTAPRDGRGRRTSRASAIRWSRTSASARNVTRRRWMACWY